VIPGLWRFTDVLKHVSEYHPSRRRYTMVSWEIPIGAAIAFGAGAIGTGLAQARIGAAGAGTLAERPELSGIIMILEAIPETLTILGFVVAAMIMIMLK
jgi:V/A-type H+-transporting ATPase subunit K